MQSILYVFVVFWVKTFVWLVILPRDLAMRLSTDAPVRTSRTRIQSKKYVCCV